MKCKTPFRRGVEVFACTRCMPCRINYQRLWTVRQVLEAGQVPASSFVTLTYDEQNHPADGSVSVREAQLFLKRLRERIGKFRYYLVGEYGERTWRPHYHANLFGVRDGCGVREAWGKGGVHISGVGPESCAYLAGYVCKGARNAKEMRWHGKSLAPEFSLMSRKPGLGAVAAMRIASFYSSRIGQEVALRDGVSSVVRQGQEKWPLGSYLRGLVFKNAGLNREELSKQARLRLLLEMRTMDQTAWNTFIEQAEGISERSGLKAEERYRRKKLERIL